METVKPEVRYLWKHDELYRIKIARRTPQYWIINVTHRRPAGDVATQIKRKIDSLPPSFETLEEAVEFRRDMMKARIASAERVIDLCRIELAHRLAKTSDVEVKELMSV